MVPTRVSHCRSRYPLRCPVRVGVRSCLSHHVLADLQLWQRLAQHPHPLAQKVDVAVQGGLAQQSLQAHPEIVGHRVGPPFGDLTRPDETHTLAVSVNGPRFYTPLGTLSRASRRTGAERLSVCSR